MKKLIAVLVLFIASCAQLAPAYAASYVADLGSGNSVLATDKPCQSQKVIELLQRTGLSEGALRQLRAATVTFNGKTLEACYLVNNPVMAIADETGDSGVIPLALFKPVTDI